MFRSLLILTVIIPSLAFAASNKSCYDDYSKQAEYQCSALYAGLQIAGDMGNDPGGKIVLIAGTVFGFTEVVAFVLAAIDGTVAASQKVHNAYLDLNSSLQVIGQAEQGVQESPELQALAAEVTRQSGKTLSQSEISGRLKLLSVSRSICKNSSRTSAKFYTYNQIATKIGKL